jgi:hypothetical protein
LLPRRRRSGTASPALRAGNGTTAVEEAPWHIRRVVVPQVKTEHVVKPETLDVKHAAMLKQIEQLPKSMTRTFTNAAVSKPVKAQNLSKLDKGLKNY